MKQFKRRPEVELLEISGEYLLAATRNARAYCPYVTQINESAASYWKLLDRPYSIDELTERAAEVFQKEKKRFAAAHFALYQETGKKRLSDWGG